MELARKILVLLLLATGIAAALMACVYLPRWSGQAPLREPGFTAAELITIVLTAVTVILAVLAIVLALFAVWGYSEIKIAAIARAEAAASETAKATAESVALRTMRELKPRLPADGTGDAFAEAAVKGGPDVNDAG